MFSKKDYIAVIRINRINTLVIHAHVLLMKILTSVHSSRHSIVCLFFYWG